MNFQNVNSFSAQFRPTNFTGPVYCPPNYQNVAPTVHSAGTFPTVCPQQNGYFPHYASTSAENYSGANNRYPTNGQSSSYSNVQNLNQYSALISSQNGYHSVGSNFFPPADNRTVPPMQSNGNLHFAPYAPAAQPYYFEYPRFDTIPPYYAARRQLSAMRQIRAQLPNNQDFGQFANSQIYSADSIPVFSETIISANSSCVATFSENDVNAESNVYQNGEVVAKSCAISEDDWKASAPPGFEPLHVAGSSFVQNVSHSVATHLASIKAECNENSPSDVGEFCGINEDFKNDLKPFFLPTYEPQNSAIPNVANSANVDTFSARIKPEYSGNSLCDVGKSAMYADDKNIAQFAVDPKYAQFAAGPSIKKAPNVTSKRKSEMDISVEKAPKVKSKQKRENCSAPVQAVCNNSSFWNIGENTELSQEHDRKSLRKIFFPQYKTEPAPGPSGENVQNVGTTKTNMKRKRQILVTPVKTKEKKIARGKNDHVKRNVDPDKYYKFSSGMYFPLSKTPEGNLTTSDANARTRIVCNSRKVALLNLDKEESLLPRLPSNYECPTLTSPAEYFDSKDVKIDWDESLARGSYSACVSPEPEWENDTPYSIEKRALTKMLPLANGNFESLDHLKARLTDRPKMEEVPVCSCQSLIPKTQEPEYYTHLAAGKDVDQIRQIMAIRSGFALDEIRMEVVELAAEEAVYNDGCPMARQILRRISESEKLLCVVRERIGHVCATAFICVAIVVHDGVDKAMADNLYKLFQITLPNYPTAKTNRSCEINNIGTCACQGLGRFAAGSFTFGCNYSVFSSGRCKFAYSQGPKVRRFQLVNSRETDEELVIETELNNCADFLAPIYKQMAPAAYANQNAYTELAKDCRLGNNNSTPFAGVTACVDFAAHPHQDKSNMCNGCTVVVSLTKHRSSTKPDEEQLHVLPKLKLAAPPTLDDYEERLEKIGTGQIELLQQYRVWKTERELAIPKKTENPVLHRAYMRISNEVLRRDNVERLSETDQQLFRKFNNITYTRSNCEDVCSNENAGGLALALGHGSILFEVAKRELHATTAVPNPNLKDPKRISLIFYQHHDLNTPKHAFHYVRRVIQKKKDDKAAEAAKLAKEEAACVVRQKYDRLRVKSLAVPAEEKVPKKRVATTAKSSIITSSANSKARCESTGKYCTPN